MALATWAIVIAALLVVGLILWSGRAILAVIVLSLAVWLRRRARARRERG